MYLYVFLPHLKKQNTKHMKTIVFCLATFLALVLQTVSSKAKVQVNLKVNEEFIYDWESNSIDQNLFMLPSMIMQPIAENALTHGLQHKPENKKLSIRITKLKNAIQISIEDNGIGIVEAKKLKTDLNGVGLRLNEERIQMMKEKYGGNYSLKLINLAELGMEGTRVEIIIPEEQ